MKYNLNEEQLKLICINLSDEIKKKGDELLNNKDVTIFNSYIFYLIIHLFLFHHLNYT